MQRAGRQVVREPEIEPPLVGLEMERRRVVRALEKREPLLLLGPAGSGKTRLLRVALEETARPALYVPWQPVLHDLLADLARKLRLPAAAKTGTSVHLRGLLWSAFETRPCPLVLDGVHRAGARAYRFFQRVYHTPGMSMIASSRDLRTLDMMGRLFWDPRITLELSPLSPAESLALFEALADRLGLRQLELDGFREQVLDAARGNPGEIVEMCRLATRPQYWWGKRIKFAPLRIDAVMRMMA